MPSRNTIEIVIQGDDKASKVIGHINSSLDTLGKASLGVIAGGVAAATAAIAGFGATALNEFTTYQKGISEVFTLIPQASEQTRKFLEADIRNISEQFGKLSSEVIPAVYQSLSAGVPPENIFEFVSAASKASIAGVTTLETAVNGISSVLNAYGLEASEAGRISDIMFTGVRLGKTTFDELSSSIFQLLPSLTDIGISFEQSIAAIDSLTSLGTPTSVAVTQIRAMLVELQKPTTEVSKLFQEMAGKSFPDFIKQGGSLSDALNLIRKGADESDKELGAVFGSVEALNAFLALTGPNAERFAGFIDEMGASAGATDKAFEEMSKTVAFQSDKMRAKLSGLLINVGRQLEPFAAKVLSTAGDALTVFDRFLSGHMEDLESADVGGFGAVLRDFLVGIKPAFDELRRLMGGFFGAIEAGIPFVDVLRVYINAILPPELLQPFDDFLHLINDIGNAIGQALAPIIEWVKNNIELKDVLIVIAGAIATVVLPAILGIVSALVSFAAPIAALIAGVSLLRQAWENDFLGIRTFVTEKLIPALTDLADWFLSDALPSIVSFIQTQVIPKIFEFIVVLKRIWDDVRPGLENLYNWFINEALPAIVEFFNTTVMPLFNDFVNLLKTIWDNVSPALTSLADWWLTGPGSEIITFVRDNALVWIQSFIDTIAGIWRVVSPGLQAFFRWFSEKIPAIVKFVQDAIKVVQDLIALLSSLDLNTGGNAADVGRQFYERSSGAFGSANGMDYVPYNQMRFLHRGESVLTADETEARMNGAGGNTTNVVVNLSGNYRNQNEANRDVDMLTNALKLKGIQLSRA